MERRVLNLTKEIQGLMEALSFVSDSVTKENLALTEIHLTNTTAEWYQVTIEGVVRSEGYGGNN